MTIRAEAVLASVRAGYGVIQLAAPEYSAERQLGGPLDPATLRVVRVLGARQVAQAGLALATPRWRRPALVSGLTAAAFAAAGVLAARRIPGNRTFD